MRAQASTVEGRSPEGASDAAPEPAEAALGKAIAAAGLVGDAADRLLAAITRITDDAVAATGRRRAEQIERLLGTAVRITESLDLDTVLSAIVEDARALLRADSGDMLLWDRERDRLRVVAVSRRPTDLLGFEMAFGEGLSTQAILAQRAIWVDDYATYPHRARGLERYHFGSVICAPLLFRGQAIGALNLHATQGGHRFGAEDADLLAAFAGHAAIALDHARRYENEVHLGRILAETNGELSRSLVVQQRLAEQVLLDRGIPKKRVHIERFTADRPSEAISREMEQLQVRAQGVSVSVTLDGRTRRIPFAAGNILDSARTAGLPAPYACKAGVCATCRARVTRGKVEMGSHYGLTEEEIASGYVLTCQSVPLGDDVAVDYDR